MQPVGSASAIVRLVSTLLLAAFTLVIAANPADAHARLLQSSPRDGSTVGGGFHDIALQFAGLDETDPQRVELLDPAGAPVESRLLREGQRLVLLIDPLTVPGIYTVSYTVNGDDDDTSSGTFVFRYDPEAEHPEGLTIGAGTGTNGLDLFAVGLLAVGAVLIGFLMHRVRLAWRDHRGDSTLDPPAELELGDTSAT